MSRPHRGDQFFWLFYEILLAVSWNKHDGICYRNFEMLPNYEEKFSLFSRRLSPSSPKRVSQGTGQLNKVPRMRTAVQVVISGTLIGSWDGKFRWTVVLDNKRITRTRYITLWHVFAPTNTAKNDITSSASTWALSCDKFAFHNISSFLLVTGSGKRHPLNNNTSSTDTCRYCTRVDIILASRIQKIEKKSPQYGWVYIDFSVLCFTTVMEGEWERLKWKIFATQHCFIIRYVARRQLPAINVCQ